MKKKSSNFMDDWKRKSMIVEERNIDEKVDNKKPPDLREVLKEKLMSYNWGLKKIRKSSQI